MAENVQSTRTDVIDASQVPFERVVSADVDNSAHGGKEATKPVTADNSSLPKEETQAPAENTHDIPSKEDKGSHVDESEKGKGSQVPANDSNTSSDGSQVSTPVVDDKDKLSKESKDAPQNAHGVDSDTQTSTDDGIGTDTGIGDDSISDGGDNGNGTRDDGTQTPPDDEEDDLDELEANVGKPHSYLTMDELRPYQALVDELTYSDACMASTLIDGYLGRSYALTLVKDKVKVGRNGRGKLTKPPIAEIRRVYILSDSIFGKTRTKADLEDFDLDYERDGYFTFTGSLGFLSMFFGRPPRYTLEVTYKSGFRVYPQRLKDACGMLACNIRQAKSFNGAKQLTSLDFQVMMTDDSFFTSDIKMLLKGLRNDARSL